uniref:Uncharacterized protein n=1 Tax=Rhizophora mucronata TaxID=61149 RepID=A0A2P2PRG1_RHIMU
MIISLLPYAKQVQFSSDINSPT